MIPAQTASRGSATVSVKKKDDVVERFQIKTPILFRGATEGLLEKRKGWTKLPNGLIIQWGIAPNHKTQFGCVYEEFAREFEKEAFV